MSSQGGLRTDCLALFTVRIILLSSCVYLQCWWYTVVYCGILWCTVVYCSVHCTYHPLVLLCVPSMYIIERETFEGENFHELVENKIFTERTFTDCSLVLPIVPLEDITPPNFAKKTFMNSHKTSKIMKVFSLKGFPLYGAPCWFHQLCTPLCPGVWQHRAL